MVIGYLSPESRSPEYGFERADLGYKNDVFSEKNTG
jgi:hypothetical protein